MQIIGFDFHPHINRVLFILKLYYNGKTVNIQGHESTEISHVFASQ